MNFFKKRFEPIKGASAHVTGKLTNLNMLNVKILKVKDGTFVGDDGEKVPYYWYKALSSEGTRIEFGSRNLYKEGEQVTKNIAKYTQSNGRTGWKEFYD